MATVPQAQTDEPPPKYETYNYPHFMAGPDEYAWEWFRENRRVGEVAPDFEAVRLDDGQRVRLSDFTAEKIAVIEFGSFTCPFCRLACPGMEELAEEYSDKGFEFLFVYTREAHPGVNFPPHETLEQKMEQARAFPERLGAKRTILVDDVEGTVHHQFGILPDMCYMIGARGREKNVIHYRSDWTNAPALRMILDYQLERVAARDSNRRVGPNYTEFLGFRPRVFDKFPEFLEVSGTPALDDWNTALEYWSKRPPSHG